MAYNASELACLGVSGAGSSIRHVYFYANSADDDVTADNFFDASADQINTGDVLIVATTPRLSSLTNTAGAISLTDFDVTKAA